MPRRRGPARDHRLHPDPPQAATAATAALLAAARAATPRGGAFAQGPTTPETRKATLGFIAPTDAAPLIVAEEKGLFAEHGMPEVEVVEQASRGATRDNIILGGERGGIDGARILPPMPYLITAGRATQNNQPVPMAILARLSTKGQGLSVAEKHRALRPTVDAGALELAFGPEGRLAMTFGGGTRDLWIRYRAAAAGIDPDRDAQTIVVPPPQMVADMKLGTMDAFCVGGPWNDRLVNQRIGFAAAVTGELRRDHPETSLGMRADRVERNPNAAVALTAAVIEAQRWCDQDADKAALMAAADAGPLSAVDRAALLAGRRPDGAPPSPLVCACHGVTEAAILGRGAAADAAAAGGATRAGTGCGSCRPEIAALLARPRGTAEAAPGSAGAVAHAAARPGTPAPPGGAASTADGRSAARGGGGRPRRRSARPVRR